MSPGCPQCAHCEQCGSIGCQEKYEEILAFEFEDPAVFGAVHHITVMCHNLQHQGTFSGEALAWMRSSLHAVIRRGLTPARLLEQSRKTFDGRVKIRHAMPAEIPRRTRWSMTVTDVRTDSPEVYVKDIKAWAESILKDLDVSDS